MSIERVDGIKCCFRDKSYTTTQDSITHKSKVCYAIKVSLLRPIIDCLKHHVIVVLNFLILWKSSPITNFGYRFQSLLGKHALSCVKLSAVLPPSPKFLFLSSHPIQVEIPRSGESQTLPVNSPKECRTWQLQIGSWAKIFAKVRAKSSFVVSKLVNKKRYLSGKKV